MNFINNKRWFAAITIIISLLGMVSPVRSGLPLQHNLSDLNSGQLDNVVVLCAGPVAGGEADERENPTHGGSAGLIDIRTGVDVDTGDGSNGDLTGSVVLTSGVYNFRQVLGAEVTIDGDVTIKCQFVFGPSVIDAIFRPDSPPPSLTVYAGADRMAGTEVEMPHFLNFVMTPHSGTYAEPGDIYHSDGAGIDGGILRFYTTARGDISVGVIADGTDGKNGGSGGNGGNVTLVATEASVIFAGGIMADGGDGANGTWEAGSPDSYASGGNGGNGGKVIVIAESVETVDILTVNAGRGGHGIAGTREHPDGGNGGNGGLEGSIRIETLIQAQSPSNVVANGADGGHGGSGYSRGLFSGSEDGQMNGGYGGKGGNGGEAGILIGITGTATAGNGGDGGWGGLGLSGPSHWQDGVIIWDGPGGDGGAGGDGGDSGGTGARPGDGGRGGNGGGGDPPGKGGLGGRGGKGGDGASPGLNGQDGEDGPGNEAIPRLDLEKAKSHAEKLRGELMTEKVLWSGLMTFATLRGGLLMLRTASLYILQLPPNPYTTFVGLIGTGVSMAVEWAVDHIRDARLKLLERIINDPPDSDYAETIGIKEFVNFTPPKDTLIEAAFVNFINGMAENSAVLEALIISIERYEGARLANEDEYILLQAKAVKDYSEMVVENLGRLNGSLSEMIDEIKVIESNSDVLAAVEEMKDRLIAQGFTQEEIQFLKDSGINDSEIEDCKQMLLSFDISDFRVEIEELQQVLDEGVPVYSDLADQASLVIEMLASTKVRIVGDFCGPNFGPPEGYVDVWDLMQFADRWHTRTGEGNWDLKYDLTGPSFGDLDGYVDVWDLMVFADHWHEGQKP